MIIRAIYEDGVLKPLKKLDLPERAEVSVIIMGSFSKLIEEIKAKEDIDEVCGILDTSTIIKSFFNKTNKETEDKTRLHLR